MDKLTIFHNPACSHSRGALEILLGTGRAFDLIEYLKTPPDRAALERILTMLEGPPADLVRKDRRFEELGLKADSYVTPKAIVALLLEHPELMQRPIIIRGSRAVIARPADKLNALL